MSKVKSALVLILAWASMAAAAADVAIQNVHIHTSSAKQLPEPSTILIQQGRVVALGPDVVIPPNVEIIDGTGKVVTAGLVEPHSQIGIEEISAVDSTIDSRGGEHASGPAFDVQYAVNEASTLLQINLVEGVTHAVTAPAQGDDVFAGLGVGLVLSGDALIMRPKLALFGAVTARSAQNVGGSRAEVITHLRRTFRDLKTYRQQRAISGPSYTVAYGTHQERSYSKIDMDALALVREQGLPVVLHVDRANEIKQVLRLAAEHDLPVVIRGAAEGWKVASELAAAKVPVIIDPMNNLPTGFDRLGARADNAALLDEAGVQVAFTVSDPHNARQLRQLAGNAVANGMDWSAALRAITNVPADIFGLSVGRIAVGEPATLVLWNGDPLEVTSWAEAVMVDGRWIDSKSRQTRLFERYRDLGAGKERGFTYR